MELEWQLALLSRRCARHRRKAWREREAALIEELQEAQRGGRLHEVHMLRRLIAANKRGPKKRIVGVMANFHPCAREVLDFYAHAGPQGGAAAVQVDFDDMLMRHKNELTGLRLLQRGSARQAARDLADISRAVRKAAKRKWVPEWALPL